MRGVFLAFFLVLGSRGAPQNGGNQEECPPQPPIQIKGNIDTTGVEGFAMRLFSKMSEETNGNLMISPYSIWSALSAVLLGADGETKRELEFVLGYTLTEGRFRKALDAYFGAIANGVNKPELVMYNKAFFDRSVPLEKCIFIPNKELQVVNFSRRIRLSNAINAVVNNATRGLITKIVDPNDLQRTLFLLLNAVYFKGTWSNPFPVANTEEGRFFDGNQNLIGKGPMMVARQKFFLIGQSDTLQATVLLLPYAAGNEDSTIQMIIMVPYDDRADLHDCKHIIKTLEQRPGAVTEAKANLARRRITLHMPKFSLESSFTEELKMGLFKMGLRKIFTSSANLSKFAPNQGLFVDKLIHKVVVKVDEKGTEAAAVTAILGTRGFQRSSEIFLNRPFVFLIQDLKSAVTLFSGVIQNPFPGTL